MHVILEFMVHLGLLKY